MYKYTHTQRPIQQGLQHPQSIEKIDNEELSGNYYKLCLILLAKFAEMTC